MYEKVKRNAPDLRVSSKDEMIYLAKEFVSIGKYLFILALKVIFFLVMVLMLGDVVVKS